MNHFQLIVTTRIAEHKAAEERRAADLAERERERIRQEEEARAAANLRRQQEEAARAAAPPPSPAPSPAPTAAPIAAAAPNVVPMQRPAAATAMPATLNLGAICARLGFTMTADFVKRLGTEPAATDKSAKLYTEAQFQVLCDSLVAHIRTVAHQQQAA